LSSSNSLTNSSSSDENRGSLAESHASSVQKNETPEKLNKHKIDKEGIK